MRRYFSRNDDFASPRPCRKRGVAESGWHLYITAGMRPTSLFGGLLISVTKRNY
jgi:hypothetical protein